MGSTYNINLAHAKKLIPSLRSLLLRRQFRKLFLEFTLYLKSHYLEQYKAELTRKGQGYWNLFKIRLRGLLSKQTFLAIENQYKSCDNSHKLDHNLHFNCQFYTDLNKGRLCLSSYLNSSFFAWDRGSSLFFWRWTDTLKLIARDGFEPCIVDTLPTSKKKVSRPNQPIYDKILSKLKKAIERGYLHLTPSSKVFNVIDYFGVEKGETDIRVVFNGTSCGLNNSVWAPNFWLPTAKTMVRALGYNFKAVDIDLGEMFLNFPLHKKLIPYSGVDISPFKEDLIRSRTIDRHHRLEHERCIATWNRDWMGFKPSPEWSCRFYYLAEEFLRGDEKDISNPLYWKTIILNLIGNEDFNPSLPNIYKWDDLANDIAGDIKAYVDDLRTFARTLEQAWRIARIVAARLQFLGIQDAPRKRRTDNGPWAGTIYKSTPSNIQTTVSLAKWKKGQQYIQHLNAEIMDNPNGLFDFKLLERIRGFLCHLAMTYELLFPFLKGFHLTLCAHMPSRDEEGWKLSELEFIGYLEERLARGKISSSQYSDELGNKFDPKNQPKRVKLVPRFFTCLTALSKFFELDLPPIVTHRSTNIKLVAYGFVDASKGGFGSSIDFGVNTKYRIGVWGADTDSDSSNFREFCNLVETLEEEEKSGSLNNAYLIMATDNSTVEAALFKGNSTSKKLFDLIVRFRFLELRTGSTFVVTHVSGTRMKSQGTDGISRGQLSEGITIGEYMLSFCPWGKDCLERSPLLKEWIQSIFGEDCEFLTPSQWYTRGHDHCGGYMDQKGYWRIRTKPGTFVWTPPPAAADAALEELRKARLKRRESTHIVIIPRLATTLWLKQANKACDLVIHLPNHFSFWSQQMHEPLVIAICYPYLEHRPWQLRGTPKMFESSRKLRRLLSDPEVDARSVLFKFHSLCKRLPTMQESMVRNLLYFQSGGKVLCPSSSSSRRGRR